jgi:hypothetical protein
MIILILTITIVSLLLPNNKTLQTYLGVSACIIFSCVIGLRSFDSGTDTLSYVSYFNSIHEDRSYFEPLFYFFTLFFAAVSSSVTYIFSLSAIPIFLVLFAAMSAEVSRPALIVCLFLCFVPGIDLITNGVRSGLSLSVGLWIAVLSSRYTKTRYLLSSFPIFVHYSYIIVLLSDVSSRFLSMRKLTIANGLGCLLIVFWLLVDAQEVVTYITDFYFSNSDGFASIIDKSLRYLINRQSFLSQAVFMYFALLSIFLGLVNSYFIRVKKITSSRTTLVLYSLSTLTFLCFALVSFSPFSYRFMFIAYVFQIFLFGCLLDILAESDWAKLAYFFLISVSSVITYTTATMTRFTFLNLT